MNVIRMYYVACEALQQYELLSVWLTRHFKNTSTQSTQYSVLCR